MRPTSFFTLTLGGFFAVMVANQIHNKPMAFFAFVLMLLPSAAIIYQSEVK